MLLFNMICKYNTPKVKDYVNTIPMDGNKDYLIPRHV